MSEPRGQEAINGLNDEYSIKRTPDGWEISWRENPVVFIPTVLVDGGISQPHLEKICHNGRNVKGMTRVTGYMSYVDNFNKGKTAELKDRHHTPVL